MSRGTEPPGKAEPRDEGVVEAGHRADPVAGERQHQHPGCAIDAGRMVAHVHAEGWLSVGARGNKSVGAAVGKHAGAQEWAGDVDPFIRSCRKGCREYDVFAEQAQHGIDIADFVRLRETLDDFTFPR